MKTNRLRVIFTVVLLISTVILLITAAFASAITYVVEINYPYEGKTEHFVLDNAAYYKDFSVSAGDTELSFSVDRIDVAEQTIVAYDLLVFASDGSVAIGANQGAVHTISTGFCTVFSQQSFPSGTSQQVSLTLTSVATDTIKIVVINYSEKNRYVSDFYSLKKCNNEDMHNSFYDDEMPVGRQDYFKYIYILDSFTTDESFVFNCPSEINLLYSTITLGAPFNVSHPEKGAYEITAITGRINNDNFVFSITAPKAYYRTEGGIGSIVTNSVNYVKNSNDVDFSLAENVALLTALRLDAEEFIRRYIPQQVFSDVILPSEYHDYAVYYSYLSSDTNSFSNLGKVTRATATSDVDLSIGITFDSITETVTERTSVIGSSSESFIAGFGEAFVSYSNITAVAVTENLVTTHYLKKELEIGEFVRDYLIDSGYTSDFSLSVVATEDLSFRYLGVSYNTIDFSYDMNNTRYYVSFDGDTPLDLASKYFYLVPQTWMLIGGTVNLSVTDGVNTFSVPYNLMGVSLEQQQAYLERFIETSYLSSNSDVENTIRIAADGIYRGSVADNSIIIPYTLGLESVDYSSYIVSNTVYESLQRNDITLSAAVASGTSANANFDFSVAGQFALANNAIISLADNQSLILVMNFNYLDPQIPDYQTYREIIIPASGLGGDEYLRYISGNTFGEFFDSLEEGRLIDSTADTVGGNGNAYRFESGTAGVHLALVILSENVEDFCRIVNTENYYQIDIVVGSIPPANTTIQVQAIFYLSNIDDPISVQNYSFIIPGIYSVGNGVEDEFVDTNLYNRIITARDASNNLLYESYDGYLLVDGANSSVPEFDCSLSALNGVSATDVVDLTGIHLLTNTASMVFDNCLIETLTPFGEFTEHNLVSLSLNNCGITNAMFTSGSLYNLRALEAVSLNGNAITQLSDVNGNPTLYRTLKSLYMENQTADLTRINGIEDIPYLETVSLKNNKIQNFTPLVSLNNLTSVYLGDNTATEFATKKIGDTNTYYGTNGEVSIPVYVTLIDKGVDVYIDNTGTPIAIGDGEYISNNEYSASLLINTVFIFGVQYDSIDFPVSIKTYDSSTGTEYLLPISYFVVENAVKAVDPTNSVGSIDVSGMTIVSNETVRIIARVSYLDSTVYKEFEVVYKTSTTP